MTEPHISTSIEPGTDEAAPRQDAFVLLRARGPGLPRRAVSAARSICEALFVREDGAPDPSRLAYVERELVDFFANVTLRARLLFRLCVAAVFWLAPVLIGRLPPLSRLSVADRVEALHRFEESSLSLALLGAKAILCVLYFEHPDAAKEIGWDQRCHERSTEGS